MRQQSGLTASPKVSNPPKHKRLQTRRRLAAVLETLEPRRLLSASAAAYTITVNDTADALDNPATATVGALGANVTLRDAINAANNTGGNATIVLAKTTYDFTTVDNNWYGPDALPPIQGNITIQGNGATLQRDASLPQTTAGSFRFFYVSGGIPTELPLGTLTLQNLTLTNGLAKGGDSTRAAVGWARAGRSSTRATSRSTASPSPATPRWEGHGGFQTANAALILGGGGIGQDGMVDDGGPNSHTGGGFGGSFPVGIYGGAGGNGGGGGFDAGGFGPTGGGHSGLGGNAGAQGFGGDGGSSGGAGGSPFGFGGYNRGPYNYGSGGTGGGVGGGGGSGKWSRLWR